MPQEIIGPEQFEARLPLVEDLIRQTVRRCRMTWAEADELYSDVMMKLIDNDYAVLKRLSTNARPQPYLRAVVTRTALDLRIRAWGRWRPSTAARRLGSTAVRLDTLLHREGHSSEEAIRILLTDSRIGVTRQELRQMADQLPVHGRRRFQDASVLEQIPIDGESEERARCDERRSTASKANHLLQLGLDHMPDVDRQVLRLRFFESLSVPRIAEQLDLSQRSVYGRLERCLRRLRRQLAQRGLTWEEVVDILGRESSAIRLRFRPRTQEDPAWSLDARIRGELGGV